MTYSDLPYPIYPWIRFVTFQPDCLSRNNTHDDDDDDIERTLSLRILDCAGQHVHFLVDYDRRKIRSIKPIDWRVVVLREILVATVGMRAWYRTEQSLDSAQRVLGHCLACCLARRGS